MLAKLGLAGWISIGLGGLLVIAGALLLVERADHADTRTEFAEAVADAAEKRGKAVEAARKEEQRRYTALQEAHNATLAQLEAARSDAVAAAHAGERLRQQLAVTRSAGRACTDPAAAGSSTPADPAGDLLADVQRRLDQAADGIAGFADQAHAAGLGCERSYDALKRPRGEIDRTDY